MQESRTGWLFRPAPVKDARKALSRELNHAFPLPRSGAFDDLLRAIDETDVQR